MEKSAFRYVRSFLSGTSACTPLTSRQRLTGVMRGSGPAWTQQHVWCRRDCGAAHWSVGTGHAHTYSHPPPPQVCRRPLSAVWGQQRLHRGICGLDSDLCMHNAVGKPPSSSTRLHRHELHVDTDASMQQRLAVKQTLATGYRGAANMGRVASGRVSERSAHAGVLAAQLSQAAVQPAGCRTSSSSCQQTALPQAPTSRPCLHSPWRGSAVKTPALWPAWQLPLLNFVLLHAPAMRSPYKLVAAFNLGQRQCSIQQRCS